MGAAITVLNEGDANLREFDAGTLISRHLLRKEHGSESVSLAVLRTEAGPTNHEFAHPDHDELLYAVDGDAEIEIDGKVLALPGGSIAFCARGAPVFTYRVHAAQTALFIASPPLF